MKIVLNLIMKNEAAVLYRMLNSVCNFIDYYIIIDTGSTDDSINIVKNFFKHKQIPGEIHSHPFVDFADARNFCLNMAKDKGDYGFIIDCDEILDMPVDFNRSDFNELIANYDEINFICKLGKTEWARCALFNLHKNFYWKYPIHNVLLCSDEISTLNIDKSLISIRVTTQGNSHISQSSHDKYKKNAEIMLKYVNENPTESRAVFYLAMTYKDAGMNNDAIEWFRKRVDMLDGFYEERYYSQFMIGLLTKLTGKPSSEVIFEYMKCSELDNLRAEHLLNIIIELLDQKLFINGYQLIEQCYNKYSGKNPYPNRVLFIDEATYLYKFNDLFNKISINKPILN